MNLCFESRLLWVILLLMSCKLGLSSGGCIGPQPPLGDEDDCGVSNGFSAGFCGFRCRLCYEEDVESPYGCLNQETKECQCIKAADLKTTTEATVTTEHSETTPFPPPPADLPPPLRPPPPADLPQPSRPPPSEDLPQPSRPPPPQDSPGSFPPNIPESAQTPESSLPDTVYPDEDMSSTLASTGDHPEDIQPGSTPQPGYIPVGSMPESAATPEPDVPPESPQSSQPLPEKRTTKRPLDPHFPPPELSSTIPPTSTFTPATTPVDQFPETTDQPSEFEEKTFDPWTN